MFKRNDVIVMVVVLVLALLGYTAMRLVAPPSARAARVVALIEGIEVLSVPLSQPGTYKVPQSGDAVNAFTIADGMVRMTDANCPDSWCMKKGAVSRTADQIVCLPHKLILQLEGEAEPGLDDLDVVVQ